VIPVKVKLWRISIRISFGYNTLQFAPRVSCKYAGESREGDSVISDQCPFNFNSSRMVLSSFENETIRIGMYE